MEKKYKLTEETINVYGVTLYRIEAIISFGNVSAGEKGGYIQKEENLSQFGDAWVYGDAEVYGDAWVFGGARVFDDARVFGDARVYGDAWVYGDAEVYGDARVYGDAVIKNKGCESPKSYLTIGPVGDNRFITIEKSVSIINAGCFSGTINEFEQAVKDKYGDESDYYPVIEFFKSIL